MSPNIQSIDVSSMSMDYVNLQQSLSIAVATTDFLRSSGLPILEIYGYSPIADNAAETEYIFMEFIQGTNLSDIWYDLEEVDIVSPSNATRRPWKSASLLKKNH